MVLFNGNKIIKVSKGDIGKIIQILRIITYKIQPKNYYDKTFEFYQHRFGGESYLLNPKDLLEVGRTFSDREVAEYAGVASFRNYHNYVNTKDTTLECLLSPISDEIIKNNRLLDIKEGRITFMFEETMEK